MDDNFAYEFLQKIKYQEGKLLGNKSKLREYFEKASEVSIFPYVFSHYNTSIRGFPVTILSAFTSEAFRCRVMGYWEDKTENALWSPQEMLYGRDEKEYLVIIKLSTHYLDRFQERCPPEVKFLGDTQEASILDIHSPAVGFSNLRKLQEHKDIIHEVLKYETGNTDDHIKKTLNYNDNISICRTRWGYGVYRIISMYSQVLRISMITWISPEMMSQKQKDMISLITL